MSTKLIDYFIRVFGRKSPVDRLGGIKAKIAELEAQEKAIVDRLKAQGDGVYNGRLFAAYVVTSKQERLIAAKVREFLHPVQLLHATKEVESTSVTVRPRSAA